MIKIWCPYNARPLTQNVPGHCPHCGILTPDKPLHTQLTADEARAEDELRREEQEAEDAEIPF